MMNINSNSGGRMTSESDQTNNNIRRARNPSMVNWENFSVDGSSQGFDPEGSGYDGMAGGAAGQSPHSRVEQEREFVEQMAKKESRNVSFSRGIVVLVLLVTATLVTSMTYVFLDRKDLDSFENAFYQYALTIKDSTEFNLRGLIEATNGISQVFTSEAIKTNSTWPFMTLSSFEVYVRNTRAQGASELIVIAPLVKAEQIEEWNEYSSQNQDWIDESFQEYDQGRLDLNPIPSSVYRFGRFKGRTVLKPEDGEGGYPAAPFWQMSRPPFDTSIVNFNSLSTEENQATFDAMMATKHWVMGKAGPNTLIEYTHSEEAHDELHYAAERAKNTTGFANNHPHTALVYPVYRDKDSSHPTGNDVHSPIVAMIMNVIPWDNYLKRLLPNGVNGIYCVLQNSAGQAFTYRIDGSDAEYLGPGDLHETQFDNQEYRINFGDFLGKPSEYMRAGNTTNATAALAEAAALGDGNLQYWFSIYPSQELQSAYATDLPAIFTSVVAFIFVFMALTFFVYDRFVISKNNKIMDAATQSNAILASLFPQNVKERLLEEKADEIKADEEKRKAKRGFKSSRGMDASLEDYFNNNGAEMDDSGEEILSSKPIADLFPDATVMFADLVGFTAWSSTREPTEVFTLLETLYRNFDIIARRRRVYKVETIGDCYVAVTGCPTPRSDHHVAMCRFSIECLRRMRQLTKKLESRLGPDTSNLNMRFGIHSGAVTGGVLRGERSRFQLFGDTMNTAARMESNGQPGRVHMSGATADLLVASGKGHWLKKRDDKIVAKGKGELQTFWLAKTSGSASTIGGSESHFSESSGDTSETSDVNEVDVGDMGVLHMNSKTQRVVDWTVQSLMNLLERLAGSREQADSSAEPKLAAGRGKIPVEEIQEVIHFQRKSCEQNQTDLVLDQRIEDQLEMYVGTIAGMYTAENAFHNFEHASHVTMTILKLKAQTNDGSLGDGSLGFSSDHLAVFACAFAALIHDVQHPGVANFQLQEELPTLAAKFKSRSIAEQNSFTVAWDLLSEDRFKDLRNVIYTNEAESTRFRHLVIQAVMATDLFDKDNAMSREDRWNKAFNATGSTIGEESPIQLLDRKDTLVLEHLTMAADISHTMQHWDIYRKWNTNLFEEMYAAYKSGRADKDPSPTWYGGELWFFDNHVIPLATKIQQFGCFGIMGEDLLKHAKQNRREWEEKGRQIVTGMLKAVNGDENTTETQVSESFNESPSDEPGPSDHWEDEEITDQVDV